MKHKAKQSNKEWMKIKGISFFLFSFFIFQSCVKTDLVDEDFPDQTQIELTTDWTARGIGIAIPDEYKALVDNKILNLKGAKNNLPILAPGTYHAYIYNEGDKITVNGTTATVETTNGTVAPNPDWLFTAYVEIVLAANKKTAVTATMTQQIRQLNIELTVKEGDANRIQSVTASLDGIASQLNMANNEHSAAAKVIPVFTRANDKLSASIRLLGITGASQKLTLNITFADGKTQALESDLTSKLSGFNTNKKEPLTLSADINTAVEVGRITATINNWILGGNKPGTAN